MVCPEARNLSFWLNIFYIRFRKTNVRSKISCPNRPSIFCHHYYYYYLLSSSLSLFLFCFHFYFHFHFPHEFSCILFLLCLFWSMLWTDECAMHMISDLSGYQFVETWRVLLLLLLLTFIIRFNFLFIFFLVEIRKQ